jgi:hypothetical protein
MKLTKADVGKKFNCHDGLLEVLYVAPDESCVKFNDTNIDHHECIYLVRTRDGVCLKDGDISITSRHNPRSWLPLMPNLGDIKEGWIACDKSGDWCAYTLVPEVGNKMFISKIDGDVVNLSVIFNTPALTGDQWKDSLISVAELKQWQADNKG